MDEQEIVVEKALPPEEVSTKTRNILTPTPHYAPWKPTKADFPNGMYQEIIKQTKDPNRQRGLVFQNEKQRNAMAIQKGLTKPGQIDYGTLRRISMSVYVARICINSLKSKVTKTPWVIQPIDQLKRKGAKDSDKRIKEVEDFLKHPNLNDETFRTLLDKMVEDLLVLDAVTLEKTRYPDGKLAELHFVDSATIRPVYDEYGNQDLEIPLATKGGLEVLPVSYVQVMNNSQYGGPESGDIVAAWPKKDVVHFHMHPQGSLEGFGYGLSPLESVLSVVSNLLNSDNYNSTYFEEGAFPPIILNIVGSMNQRDLDAWREYWYQEISGNFHRPAVMASTQESKVLNLKEFSNNDMQFMEFTKWLAMMMCAIMEMSPQDIGITDTTGSKNVSETQKDISESKGYGSILNLLTQEFNQEILWKDFGYDDLEFAFVSTDDLSPEDAINIYDKALRNGTMTINEVRAAMDRAPYDSWADEPLLLSANGYVPLQAPQEENGEEIGGEVGGEKPYNEQDTEDIKSEKISKMQKSTTTQSGCKVWADDRGVAQPFIVMDIKNGMGKVIKPPIAVNVMSQRLEQELSVQLSGMGLNVPIVRKMTHREVLDMFIGNPEVVAEFEKYCMMAPEYDSEKWRNKYGGSRRYDYYLVSDYIDGYSLTNPRLLADMQRDPASYTQAINDLANLWKVEKEMVLGDRRADQYIITEDKRAFGIDYQFMGDIKRWEKFKDAISDTLKDVPELNSLFKTLVKEKNFTLKSLLKRIFT